MSPRGRGSAERTAARRRLEVVLAEDNDDHALLIRMALERATGGELELHRARNGEEAVERVRETSPDLLLLDLKMPHRSGHEVLDLLKGDPDLRKIPVAVLTSSDRDEDVARSYGLGGNHFITKPESPAELEQRLRALIRNLEELGAIRRGRGSLEATAASAVSPQNRARRTVVTWGAVLLMIVALVLYALWSGVIP